MTWQLTCGSGWALWQIPTEIIGSPVILDFAADTVDQTQVIFALGDRFAYAPVGEKQVMLVGGDEKRAFTVMVLVSNSSAVLPFQAIYVGKTS